MRRRGHSLRRRRASMTVADAAAARGDFSGPSPGPHNDRTHHTQFLDTGGDERYRGALRVCWIQFPSRVLGPQLGTLFLAVPWQCFGRRFQRERSLAFRDSR
jgi:hypothetical protein